MYSLVLIAALTQGAVAPGAGDISGAADTAPPGASSPVGSSAVPVQPAPKSSGGFFHRLFGRGKDTAAPAAPAPPLSPAAAFKPSTPADANQPKVKGGFFHNLFKCNDYDNVSFEQEKKWEKSLMNEPD